MTLTGLLFDWEQLAAPDMIGIPAADSQEALNYLKFLSVATEITSEVHIDCGACFLLVPWRLPNQEDGGDRRLYRVYDL
jgi:hypothetical protein